MNACLRQAKYAELLNLHRFITQAAISANIVTYNLVITTYLECRKVDTALEHYKQLVENAPFEANSTTYRVLVKGLVDNGKLDKEDILGKGWEADATVYSYLMSGEAKNGNWEGVFGLYEELKEKLGGVVYGSLIKGYFLRGMEDEAMRCFEEVFGDGSKVKMSAVAWNSVLDALFKNGKFDVGLKVFDKMLGLHDPPKVLMVNLGSYNVVVDGYCGEKRFDDAIKVFNSMGEKRCYPDTLSFNNLIEQLCENGLLGYFKAMVEAKLRPNLGVYNRLMDGLVKVGKVDEAKAFFDMMVPKLRMDDDSYKFIMKALFDIKKLDEVLEIIGKMLREEPLDFSEELQEFVREELRKEEREEELVKLMADVEREKAEAAAKAVEEAERAKASTRAAVSSLLPSRLFGDKVDEENEEGNKVGEENVEENEAGGEVNVEEDDASGEQVNA
ncbi:pentatricopeptide repeat-containing protein [Tanacetum coccineum]